MQSCMYSPKDAGPRKKKNIFNIQIARKACKIFLVEIRAVADF